MGLCKATEVKQATMLEIALDEHRHQIGCRWICGLLQIACLRMSTPYTNHAFFLVKTSVTQVDYNNNTLLLYCTLHLNTEVLYRESVSPSPFFLDEDLGIGRWCESSSRMGTELRVKKSKSSGLAAFRNKVSRHTITQSPHFFILLTQIDEGKNYFYTQKFGAVTWDSITPSFFLFRVAVESFSPPGDGWGRNFTSWSSCGRLWIQAHITTPVMLGSWF